MSRSLWVQEAYHNEVTVVATYVPSCRMINDTHLHACHRRSLTFLVCTHLDTNSCWSGTHVHHLHVILIHYHSCYKRNYTSEQCVRTWSSCEESRCTGRTKRMLWRNLTRALWATGKWIACSNPHNDCSDGTDNTRRFSSSPSQWNMSGNPVARWIRILLEPISTGASGRMARKYKSVAKIERIPK